MTFRRDLTLSLEQLKAADPVEEDKFRSRATVTFPEMRSGNVAVCIGTVMGRVPYGEDSLHGSTLDFPTHEQVYAFARGQLAYYEAMAQSGFIRPIKTSRELESHWLDWQKNPQTPIGIIVSMEGADAMPNSRAAESWYDLGLRSTGLVHYGTSAHAVGTGQEGPLSESGKSLLKTFESLGMILDVTHLSDQSFFEAVDCFSGPIIASHQACRSLVPHQRQFSDEQLAIVISRDGLVCVPCDAWMLYPNWIRGETDRSVVSMEALCDQIDHICQLAGDSKHVAIGSDLDGGYGSEQTPTGLDSIAHLQKLCELLSARDYSDHDIAGILGQNAYQFFLTHLPNWHE